MTILLVFPMKVNPRKKNFYFAIKMKIYFYFEVSHHLEKKQHFYCEIKINIIFNGFRSFSCVGFGLDVSDSTIFYDMSFDK